MYRDVLALNEAGVPIVSMPGQGYELMEGYFLPPLVFTPDEARAMFLSGRFFVAHAGGRTAQDAQLALAKLAVVLPAATRQDAERQAALVSFIEARTRIDFDSSRLRELQDAIQNRRVVHFSYHSRHRETPTSRVVEPERLWYHVNAWYLSGYCRSRQATRSFRLERMETLQILTEPFGERVTKQGGRAFQLVRIRFPDTQVRWVMERQHYAFQEAVAEEGGVIMTYRVETLSEMLPWLLGWGSAAEPLHPRELRDRVREEAQRVVRLLT
ncbi:putative transcriptional regulator [Deinococcus peraridilitoris DSM 19664]|uniref:Putative transcriptional regulator n=1 Tax=Deinococcus peraridilitoris (strain DSM 19664 / LMG 22246 / CIP 109416 / KR-200) TaxID=937777 RepID=K9ZZB5_DEIPD|nr:putative transcriptional regulator [Deinococcus peraridilitoris DSM 19664]